MTQDKGIIIIGSDLGFSASASSVIRSLEEKGIQVVVADSVDNFGELNPQYSEQYTEKLIDSFKKTRMEIPELFSQREFTCKGKHQYRETNGQWICECGRNMNT